MTGVVWRRRRAANSCALIVACARSMVTDSMAEVGMVPPPTCARPWPTEARMGRSPGVPSSAATILAARKRSSSHRHAQHFEHGNAGAAGFAAPAQIGFHRSFEARENQLAAAQRAEERIALDGADQLCFSCNHAGLRPAEQLISAEADEVDASEDRFGGCGLVADTGVGFGVDGCAAAELLGKRDVLLARERGDLFEGRRFDEAAHKEIAAMHF